jgi:RHS repeat-associated protein
LGSIVDLATHDSVTGQTTIANHRRYDAFGNLLSETNPAVDLIFGWTGRQFDDATGLQYNLNRWYDPKVGRWTTEDPIGFAAGDANLNRYVGNDPVGRTDPSGLWWNPFRRFWDWFGDQAPNKEQQRDAQHGNELRLELLGETGGNKGTLFGWTGHVGTMPGAALDCAENTAVELAMLPIGGSPIDDIADLVSDGREIVKGAARAKKAAAAVHREFSVGQIIRRPWFTDPVRNQTFPAVAKRLLGHGFTMSETKSGRIVFTYTECLKDNTKRYHILAFDRSQNHWHKYLVGADGQYYELNDRGYIEFLGTNAPIPRVHIPGK